MKQQMEGTHLHLVLAPDSPFINLLLWGGFSLGVLAFSLEPNSQVGLMLSKQLSSRERNLVGQGEFQEYFMPQPSGQVILG